jgi:hypothetical protein
MVCSAPLPMLAEEDQSEPLEPCTRCGTSYCSTDCVAADEAHSVFCGAWTAAAGSAGESSPWRKFQAFCIENSETYLFAARLAAGILLRAAGCDVDSCSGRLPGTFGVFTQPLWWDIVPVPDAIKDGPPDAINSFRMSLRSDAQTALQLLCACLPLSLQPIAAVALTLDAWGRLLGLITQNALSVKISSPLSSYLLSIAGALPHPAAVGALSVLESACRCVVAANVIAKRMNGEDDDDSAAEGDPEEGPVVVTESDMVGCLQKACALNGKRLLKKAGLASPHLQGSALFSRFSCFNHSCVPNCTVQFRESARCMVVALRDIVAGEELTISYIDQDLPLEEREDELYSYQFVCQCKRCVEERK